MKNLKESQERAIKEFLEHIYVPNAFKNDYERLLRIVNTRDLMTLDEADRGEEVTFIHVITKGKGIRETFQGFTFGYGSVLKVTDKYAVVITGLDYYRVALDGVRNIFVWEC